MRNITEFWLLRVVNTEWLHQMRFQLLGFEVDFGYEHSLIGVAYCDGDWSFEFLYFSWFVKKYYEYKGIDL